MNRAVYRLLFMILKASLQNKINLALRKIQYDQGVGALQEQNQLQRDAMADCHFPVSLDLNEVAKRAAAMPLSGKRRFSVLWL